LTTGELTLSVVGEDTSGGIGELLEKFGLSLRLRHGLASGNGIEKLRSRPVGLGLSLALLKGGLSLSINLVVEGPAAWIH
jgi:hypothetical protein